MTRSPAGAPFPPPLLLHEPGGAVTIDATSMGVSPEALTALSWPRVFAAMEALEAGALANPDEGRQVGHYWLRAPERAPTVGQAAAIGEAVDAVRAFAEGVLDGSVAAPDGGRFTDVLHVGIGGSALGPMLLVDAVGRGGLPVHVLDNTDPDGISATLARLGDRLRHALVVVVSKSGSTPEPLNGLALVQDACRRRGLTLPERTVAVTVPGSRLARRAADEGWRATFPLWEWVGGRTSATSAVGLLPLALAGGDVSAFLTGAARMDGWTRLPDPLRNPAALLAGLWYVVGGGRGDRAGVVLPYADRLVLLPRYLQQLVMESLGKRLDRSGREVFQGLTIYGNKGSTDQHAYVQQLRDGRDDAFVTFVEVLDVGRSGDVEVEAGVTTGDVLQGFLLGTRQALREAGRPSMILTVPTVDAATVGALIALFERAVGLYAELIDVNAYDQPGVEAGKRAARGVLDLSRSLRSALADGPARTADLAARVGADPVVCWHILEHLAATDRVGRDGSGPETLWRAP